MYGKLRLGVVQGGPRHPLRYRDRTHGEHPLPTACLPTATDYAERVAYLEAGPRARAQGL